MIQRIRKSANRSGLQICPICKHQRILVEHHIAGKDIPNPNHKDNVCNICDNCHRDIHNGLIIIDGWYQTTNGRELLWHLKG